jgi:phospholipid/cholesterol/gamma-HCH transport system substrate-binding protein
MPREPFLHVVRRRLLGVAMIGLVVGLVALSVAVFNKTFVNVVTVTLLTDHTGNQLDPSSDVKVRGILVGEVRSITSTGDGAQITLAVDRSKVKLIPANVTAEILPKTLFGERYVDLELPTTDAAPPIKAHSVIQQDRSSVAIQFSKVLSDVLPLLDALKPADLNATLNAMATALQGNGAQLGKNIDQLDQYLKQINPQVPALIQDLTKLGDVSDEYNQAAPALLNTLNNLQATSVTIVANQQNLSALLVNATSASNSLNMLISDNAGHLIDVAHQTNQVAAILDTYSPEYTCLLAGISGDQTLLENVFRNGELHVEVSLVQDRGKYVNGNQPILKTGLGANCYGLPNPVKPFQVSPYYSNLNDGASYCASTAQDPQTALSPSCSGAASAQSATAVGGDAEAAEIQSLIAGQYGTTPNKVPDVATVLAGPLLRGAEVSAK